MFCNSLLCGDINKDDYATLHQLRTQANGPAKDALALWNGVVKDAYTRNNPYSDTPSESHAITTALTMGADIIRQKMEEGGLPAAQAWVLSKEAKELIETIRTVHGVGEDSDVTKDTGAAKDTGTTEGIAGSTASSIPNDPTTRDSSNDPGSSTNPNDLTDPTADPASPSIFDALSRSMAETEAEKNQQTTQPTANNSLMNSGTLVAGPATGKLARANNSGSLRDKESTVRSAKAEAILDKENPTNIGEEIPIYDEPSRAIGEKSIDQVVEEITMMSPEERTSLYNSFSQDPQLREKLKSGDPDTVNRYIALTCGTKFMQNYAAFNEKRIITRAIQSDPTKTAKERLQARQEHETLAIDFSRAHSFTRVVDKKFQQQEQQRAQDWLAKVTTPEMSIKMLDYVDQINTAKPGPARMQLLKNMLEKAAIASGMPGGQIIVMDSLGDNRGVTNKYDSRFSAKLLLNDKTVDFDKIIDVLFHERTHAVQYMWKEGKYKRNDADDTRNLSFLQGS